MRKMNPLLAAGLLALLLSGCGASPSGGASGSAPDTAAPIVTPSSSSSGGSVIIDGNQATAVSSPSASPSPSEASQPDPRRSLKQAAQDILDILRSRDLDRLSRAIDPEQGLRFSPYAHIDSKSALRFEADSLPSFKDADKRIWGAYDGSGEPIELTFREYFEKFVYDQDFASAPTVSVNELASKGNVPFNGPELYPDASYVEFHFPGFDKKNEGMDWESLIVVVRQVGEDWKLCAIAHAQWTV